MLRTRDFRLKSSSVAKCVVGVVLMVSLTACGSIGGDSKETPPAPTATISPTQVPGASPTVELSAATSTPLPLVTLEPSPAIAASAAASPATTSSSNTPSNESIVTSIIGVITTSIANSGASGAASTPVGDSTPTAATPMSEATPVSALSVTSCQPDEVPPFTGTSAEYVVTEELNFRAGPGSDCDPIGVPLEAGTQLTVISDPVVREDDTTRWVQVSVDGEIGWVSLEFISPS